MSNVEIFFFFGYGDGSGDVCKVEVMGGVRNNRSMCMQAKGWEQQESKIGLRFYAW